MTIRLLSQNLINQIAAGEVVERPASVIKELIENAIDAGATEIEVKIIDAGKSHISVSDNGCGMDKQSLEMCVLSHATSKLSVDNLFDIHTFGFRGEALPSIASISRVSIESCNGQEAWRLQLEGNNVEDLSPCVRCCGTTVTVRDLFFATPARLKFLKSDLTESESCLSVFNKTALAFPKMSFKFYDGSKLKADYAKSNDIKERISSVFNKEFSDNLFEIKSTKEGLKLSGFIGVPTFNKASAGYQYFYVNGRNVKDKIFASALKSAYSGLTPQGRYPVAVLYLEAPYDSVDVNVHPAKTEIRFKDSDKIRCFIVSELKNALSSFGAIKPTTEAVNNFCSMKSRGEGRSFSSPSYSKKLNDEYKFFAPKQPITLVEKREEGVCPVVADEEPEIQELTSVEEKISLGTALYQICNTYIVSATDANLFIIDQHAAAERINLEKLKKGKIESQTLLLPEICSVTEAQVELLDKNSELLSRFGIHIEKLTGDLVNVTTIPAILGNCDVKSMMMDVIDELSNFGDAYSLNDKINHVLSTISCHGSLRAGRSLSITEMNSLLRQMEETSNIAQCCHGRPSYVVLSPKDLNKFFERC